MLTVSYSARVGYTYTHHQAWVGLHLQRNNSRVNPGLCGPISRDHFVHAPSQWETTSYCNVTHWLGGYTKWSLNQKFNAAWWETEMWTSRFYIQVLTHLPLVLHIQSVVFPLVPSYYWSGRGRINEDLFYSMLWADKIYLSDRRNKIIVRQTAYRYMCQRIGSALV